MRKDRTWAQINLNAIRLNYRVVSKKKPAIAVVKANAYGHGAVEVARVLEEEGAPLFAVACIDEAIKLRESGIKTDILIFGITDESRMAELIKYDLRQTVASVEYAKKLHKNAASVTVHIKVDTGMRRIGVFTAEEVYEIATTLNAEGIFTHFADSDNIDLTYTNMQHTRFAEIISHVRDRGVIFKYCHCANSSAVLYCDGLETFDLVRPGIAIYGIYPAARREGGKLSPAMSLYTRICDIREIKAGEKISYGCTFETLRDTKCAVLPIGYADGLSRGLSNRGEVYISGLRAPVIGRVCMDMCMVDVTDIPHAKVGDVAEIFGENISVDEIANKLDTIPYEICTSITNRVPRIYIDK